MLEYDKRVVKLKHQETFVVANDCCMKSMHGHW